MRAQPAAEFVGTLTMEWIDKTEVYSVSLLSSSSNWDLTLSCSNILMETFYDGSQTIWITHFPQASKTNKSENTVELKLFPDSRPLDLRPEEHIWMALFSGESFVNKKTPLNDIGLCIAEPCVFTSLESKTDNDASPRQALWHNTRSDNLKTIRIAGEFKWEAWTNLENGTIVPTDSELTITIGTKTVTHSRLVLTDVNPLRSKPRQRPVFDGHGLVYDFRTGDLTNRQSSEYIIQNNDIPSVDSGIATHPRRIVNAPAQPKPNPKASIRILLIIIILLLTGFFVVLYKLKTNNNNNNDRM